MTLTALYKEDTKHKTTTGRHWYLQKIVLSSTLEYNTRINTGTDKFKKQNLIIEKTANLLKLENPKTPKFYASLKIYEQENPGRPIFI